MEADILKKELTPVGQQVKPFKMHPRPVKPVVPEATDQHAGISLPGSEEVSQSKTKKKKQLQVNMGNSLYNLDSLIAWCSSLRMLIRANAYFLRMVGRRFLKKGKDDSSDQCI